MSDPILIVGGGIGGLTAALALQRQGVKTALFEQSRTIGDVGAGISLGPTATRGLYALGLEDSILAASDPVKPSAALHWQTGEVVGGNFADRDWRAVDTTRSRFIHRADLFAILENAVRAHDPAALHLDHRLRAFVADDTGVTATFQNGQSVRGAALIGSDGIRSTVRRQMLGEESPRFTGWVAYRFLVPMELGARFMSAPGTFVGPARSLLRYAIRHGSLINCVSFTRSAGWTEEGWSSRASKDELLALFGGWHADVRGLAAHAPLDGTAKWALYDRDPLPIWVHGRAALLGDAAHPMLPFLGLGAAMAIEDGVVLARAFAQTSSVEDALQLYQSARVERAGAMLLDSRHQGRIFEEGPGGALRPRTSFADRVNYDPSSAPL